MEDTELKLNKVAEDAIQKFSVAAEPQRVDVRSCLIDPLNRHGIPMSGVRVHRLLRDILKAGFTLEKAQVGVVVDITPQRLEEVVEHNKKILQGDSLLPPLAEGETPFFSVLHTNHFTMICRCFIYRWTTTKEVRELGVTDADKRLSLTRLHAVDPAFARYITEGHRAARLKSSITETPSLMKAIVAAHNHDVSMGETEGQLLAAAQDAVREKRGDVAQHAKMLEVAFPNLSHYCEPILHVAEVDSGGASPFLKDLVLFHSEHIMGLGIRGGGVRRRCGGVAPDAADLASLEEVFPAHPEAAEAAPLGPPPREFDASGNTSNEREIFARSGFVQGSRVHTKTSISYTANTSGGVRELAKGQHGHIFATDKDSISIELEGRGLVTWRWNVFPGKSLAVKRPHEKAVVENIETPHMWPLHQTDAWQFLRAKSGMVQAIAAVAERVQLVKSYVMADNALPMLSKGVNLEVMLRPTRLVKAQTAIALEKPLLLLPLTCNIGIGPLTSNNFPSALNTLTDTNGKEMVISLNYVSWSLPRHRGKTQQPWNSSGWSARTPFPRSVT